jgi:hypothetical protein
LRAIRLETKGDFMTLTHENVFVGIFVATLIICTVRAMKKETPPPAPNIEELIENKLCLHKRSMEQSFETMVNKSLVQSSDYIQKIAEKNGCFCNIEIHKQHL